MSHSLIGDKKEPIHQYHKKRGAHKIVELRDVDIRNNNGIAFGI
jgi:biotin synthase-related radical SAM superfamily protein